MMKLTNFEAMQLFMHLLAQAQAVGQIVMRSQLEKRAITTDEWDTILRADDDARQRLQEAIDAVRRSVPP